MAASLLACPAVAGARPLPATPAADLDIQGHRGCRGLLPENTMAAFEKALALRVTTIELDLQVTRDRVLVVYHDQQLDPRRCVHDDGRPVARTLLMNLRYEDLADVDCGSLPLPGFPAQQFLPGARIPRLEQVLALARGADYPVRLNLEIKMQKPEHGVPVEEFARILVGLVRRYGLVERTTIQSFHAPALLMARDLEPGISRAILVKRRGYEQRIEESSATVLSPRFNPLRAEDVRRFRERGIAVVPWTVNKPADIRRLIEWGVDGIISDYPDRVIEIVGERAR